MLLSSSKSTVRTTVRAFSTVTTTTRAQRSSSSSRQLFLSSSSALSGHLTCGTGAGRNRKTIAASWGNSPHILAIIRNKSTSPTSSSQTARYSAVEEDLDAALDDILGDVMASAAASADSSSSSPKQKSTRAAAAGVSTASLKKNGSILAKKGTTTTTAKLSSITSAMMKKKVATSSSSGSERFLTRRDSTTRQSSPRVAVAQEDDDDDEDDLDYDDEEDEIMFEEKVVTTASSKAKKSKDTPVNYRDEKFLSITNPHWIQAGLSPDIIQVLSEKGFTKFTPVQAEAFAHVMAGRDVIGQSRTGTGKTLAFGLPSFTRLVELTVNKGTRDADTGRMTKGRKCSMIILCPTRELARQVQEELTQVAKPLGLFVEVFHGGVSYDPQSKALRQGVDVIVGTPGRIIDHIDRGNLDLSEVDIVVLDEADEMLRMGFAEDVELILEGAGSANDQKFQCLLFSATAPSWVKEIARQYQKNTIAIDSTNNEGGARTATTVKHTALRLPKGANKHSMLEDIIAVEISRDTVLVGDNEDDTDDEDDSESNDEEDDDSIVDSASDSDSESDFENPVAAAAIAAKKKTQSAMQRKIFGKTIVFTETKREADELVSGGVFKSLTAQALHGDVGQKQRDATLNAFRAGAFNVLVATDVAARGIDIQDVDLVVQMGPPRDVDTYVHRSGRTGRAGQKGKSLLLFHTDQARDIVRIERDLGHGFKFDLVGPPSSEAALRAAAKTSALASKSIPDETAEYFREAAAALLGDNDNAEDVVARCLAAISRRSMEVQSRSLITGELGLATVSITHSRGKPITANDVMYTIGKLSRMSQKSEECAFESDVGKIQVNTETCTALFDMDVDEANKLIEFSRENDVGGYEFEILKELEVERDQNFGRSFERRDGGRNGRFGRDRERGGGSRSSFEPRVFRGSSSSSSSSGRYGGNDRVSKYRNSDGNYHGGNHRSDHEFRSSGRSFSRGSEGSSTSRNSKSYGNDNVRNRRFSSERSNDGW